MNADEVVAQLPPICDIVVPLANGEPVALLDALERRAEAGTLTRVRVHQMHALIDRGYFDGRYGDALRHISYFLSHVTRPYFHAGTVELVPAHFSEVPFLIERAAGPVVAMAATSIPDEHGFVTLGVNADYTANLIGRVPFYVEANAAMPHTNGRNSLHQSQITAMTRVDRPLAEVPPSVPDEVDQRIAEFVAERVPNGACIQAGIGKIPDAVLKLLHGHRDLGIHTELLTDGFIDLVQSGAATGIKKVRMTSSAVTTFALGTQALYDFVDRNPVVNFMPVNWVNDPRVIAAQPDMTSINATTEVDLAGQCASETVGGKYWSGSGGQADFARGAMFAPRGQGFIVLRSTAKGKSRIVPRLTAGSVVTTHKNTVDKVVTEHGVAELRGKSLAERAEALIAIAAPEFRDELRADSAPLRMGDA